MILKSRRAEYQMGQGRLSPSLFPLYALRHRVLWANSPLEPQASGCGGKLPPRSKGLGPLRASTPESGEDAGIRRRARIAAMAIPVPIRFSQAQRADIAHMHRIWEVEKGEGGASEERMTAYFDGRHHPQEALLPRVIYLAHEGEALIGYIAGHLTRRFACDAELEWLYVIPQRRRCGVASGLLHRLAMWFQEHHASRVCVNVAVSNVVARRFYARNGAAVMNQHWLVWQDIASQYLQDGRT